jgi:ABC-type Na+ efflux pump permease subunit
MANPKQMKQNQYVVLFMSAVLLFGAFNAVMVTADEYDPSTIVWMNFGLDLAMLVCLVALLTIIGRSAEPGGLKSAALGVGVLGVIAALIKVYARLSSDHGWWTGHLNYAIGG